MKNNNVLLMGIDLRPFCCCQLGACTTGLCCILNICGCTVKSEDVFPKI